MATKQANKQDQVSKTQSFILMKNMMRISISTICHMRELFPAECFTPTPYGSINVQQLHSAQKQDDGSLKIVNNDAFLLTQWLEKGVFSSLEREYLESMIFAVYTKHPKSGDDLLLETYEFKMSYSEGTTPASINGAPLFSKEVLKNNATRFIRQLITFTDTLDNMPENRWITIQLQYKENTPPGYEPEFFKPAEGSLVARQFLPLKVQIGSMQSGHVDMKARFAGLEKLFAEDLGKIDSLCSAKDTTHENLLAGKSFVQPKQDRVTFADEKIAEDLENLNILEDSKYLDVKNYIIKMEASTIGNCAKSLKLKPSQIKPLVERLEKEGIVKTSGRGVFELNLDLPESDDLIDTQQSELYQAEQTPKDEPVHFVTPFAPSKKLGKSAMTNCASEPPSRILDDIEESYTDDVVPFLRNTRGKRTREDPVPKDKKRDVDVPLSQASVNSEASSDKRQRRYSVIREPLNLTRKAISRL